MVTATSLTRVARLAGAIIVVAVGVSAGGGPPGTDRGRPQVLPAAAWDTMLSQLSRSPESSTATTQAAKIFASPPSSSSSFGWSTAADGDTVVVGAYGDSSYTGAAFVFERNHGGQDAWGQVQRLVASDHASYSHFGRSVAIDGDTLVVGANGADGGGAAYIFERNAGGADSWGEVARITGSDQTASAAFGWSVAISGDLVLVGAKGQSASTGAAYLYERNHGGAGGWGQVKKLTVSAGGTIQLGSAVAISGHTAVVGAEGGNAAYVFECNDGGADAWGEAAELTGSDTAAGDQFGGWVGISRDTVAVGAVWADNGGVNRGAVYVFERNRGGADSWGEVTILAATDAADNDQLGTRVSIDGDVIATGATAGDGPGVVYLFERNEGGADGWGQAVKLAASDGAELQFGVAVSGTTVILGASADSTMGFGAGAAYVFRRSGETWAQAQKMDADDTEQNDIFAFSLAMDGDLAVVGAWQDDQATGSAYVFERNQGGADSWGQVAKLTASDGGMYERFGFAVDVSDDHVVVGAPAHNGAGYMAGAAYVFGRNVGGADSWGEVAELTAPDAANYNQFGWSVGVDGDRVVVGSNKGDGQVADSGSAYLFARNQGGLDGWGLVAELDAADGAALDAFGESVATAGDWVVVGAVGDESGTGAAYVFGRNAGGADTWGELAKLTAASGAPGDQLGLAVAIAGSSILVGAPGDNAAYLYERNAGGEDGWGLSAELAPLDAHSGDRFGYAVALAPGVAAVGATYGDGGEQDSGAVYLFQRNTAGADGWGQVAKLVAADGAAGDELGHAVAISWQRLWSGAPGVDDLTANSGAAYRFDLGELIPAGDLSVTVDDGSSAVVPGETTSYAIQVANAGPDEVVGATLGATFSPWLECTWSCVPAGGSSCTAGPSTGDIVDTVDLPAGASLTYTALCSVDPGATGSIVTSAVVTAPAGIIDDSPANNGATDEDTLTAEADLLLSLDDGNDRAVRGEVSTYTITVVNAGPSSVSGATVTDGFPAALVSVTWTCQGSGGGSCTASGSGDIVDDVDLPVGATVVYTASGTVDAAAPGPELTNTASVGVPAGVSERDPASNTDTDVDVVVDQLVFRDGFEGGGTSGWSQALP